MNVNGKILLTMENARDLMPKIGGHMTGLEKAISLLGSQTELARHLNIDQSSIWSWVNRDGANGRKKGFPPGKYVDAIVIATKNRVTHCELRPDMWSE